VASHLRESRRKYTPLKVREKPSAESGDHFIKKVTFYKVQNAKFEKKRNLKEHMDII
jgi:hypothetical protein